MGERETERLRDIVSHRDHAVMVYFRRARRWEAFGRKWFGLAKRLSGTLQMMDALAKDQAATIDTLFAERDTARAECERLAALAYIGDHRFPDLTYKSRLDECAHDLRKAESERDTAHTHAARWHALARHLRRRSRNQVVMVNRALEQRRDALASLARCREVLAKVEWSGYQEEGHSECPCCYARARNGHKPDCALAAALEDGK